MQYQVNKKLTIIILLAFSILTQPLSATDEIFNKICGVALRITEYAAGTALVTATYYYGLPFLHYCISAKKRADVKHEQLKNEFLIAKHDAAISMSSELIPLRTPEQEEKHRITVILLRKNAAQHEENFDKSALKRHHLTDQSEELQPA